MSNKLVYGVGFNDAGYAVQPKVNGKQVTCPFYSRWQNMLERCYSEKFLARYPTYVGCQVAEEWKTFSVFRDWMVLQDWENKQLDKDILVFGNKIYGPDNCVFVTKSVNNFIIENNANRGKYPIGVYWDKGRKKFYAQCNNPFTKKTEYIGRFNCPNEAHAAWLKRKQEFAIMLAAEQTDERVAKAIIDRYMNYNEHNKGEN